MRVEVGNLGVLPAYMPQTVPLLSLALAFILHTDSEIFHRDDESHRGQEERADSGRCYSRYRWRRDDEHDPGRDDGQTRVYEATGRSVCAPVSERGAQQLVGISGITIEIECTMVYSLTPFMSEWCKGHI